MVLVEDCVHFHAILFVPRFAGQEMAKNFPLALFAASLGQFRARSIVECQEFLEQLFVPRHLMHKVLPRLCGEVLQAENGLSRVLEIVHQFPVVSRNGFREVEKVRLVIQDEVGSFIVRSLRGEPF